MGEIIGRNRSIIPACDVSLEVFEEIVKGTADVDGVGGYKIGFYLGLNHGLPKVVEVARRYTNKPIIYDHQKAGTDIPDMGEKFAEVCLDAGVDAVILFPQSGPATQSAWTRAAQAQGLGVIIGGEMTHPRYPESDGGYITDKGMMDMYEHGAEMRVTDFVVPGNKLDRIQIYKELIESKGITPTFYAPGFVAQGGVITEAAEVAGDNWHAIVGRGIYKAEDKKQAAIDLTSKL